MYGIEVEMVTAGVGGGKNMLLYLLCAYYLERYKNSCVFLWFILCICVCPHLNIHLKNSVKYYAKT